MFESGTDVKKDSARAMAIYQRGAQANDTASMRRLGMALESGLAGTKDPAKAFDWYRKAAALDDAEGMRLLGFLHLYGRGTAQDDAAAFTSFQKSVDAGNKGALTALGWMHERGRGTPEDGSLALELYGKGAEMGVSGCMYNLGALYESGKFTKKDMQVAREWYEKAAAAGDVESLEKLAKWHQEGSQDQASFEVPLGLCFPIVGCIQLGTWDAGKTFSSETVKKDPDEALRLLHRAYQLSVGEKKEELRRQLGILAEERPINDAQFSAQVAESFKSAPELRWENQPATADDEFYAFAIRLKDSGGGIGEVKFALDGAAFEPGAVRGLAPPGPAEFVREYRIKLPQGNHEITVSAYGSDNLKNVSTIRGTVVSSFKPVRKPELFAVVVGIDQYENDALQLHYASGDAKAVSDLLKSGGKGLFEKTHVKLLADRANTGRQAILDAIAAVGQQAQTEDVFVFYVAGHGLNVGGYKLLTADVRYLSGDRLAADSISSEELQAAIYKVPSAKKIVLLDTCHSGGAVSAETLLTRGLSDLEMVKRMNRLSGAVVIAAAETKEQAIEGYMGHGVFTFALMEAMGGAADANKDGFITTRELQDYVEVRASEIAERQFKTRQTPYPSSVGSGFMMLAHGSR